jgi:alkylhydroperoxidase/carboxymuconolactone decarboxylase family protein YurZ
VKVARRVRRGAGGKGHTDLARSLPYYELALGEGRHVSAKVREFVAIALLAFRGADREGLVAHMRRAIRLGATKEELFEVLEATLVPGGAPTFHRGLSALIEVE